MNLKSSPRRTKAWKKMPWRPQNKRGNNLPMPPELSTRYPTSRDHWQGFTTPMPAYGILLLWFNEAHHSVDMLARLLYNSVTVASTETNRLPTQKSLKPIRMESPLTWQNQTSAGPPSRPLVEPAPSIPAQSSMIKLFSVHVHFSFKKWRLRCTLFAGQHLRSFFGAIHVHLWIECLGDPIEG